MEQEIPRLELPPGPARGARVLAFLPPSRCAEDVCRAAHAATGRAGWLTLAVPSVYSRGETWALASGAFGGGAVVRTESELEGAARARLEAHLECLDRRDRVCGVVLRPPTVRTLVDRVRAVNHDLVVVPAGWRELLVVLTLRAQANTSLLLVGGRRDMRLMRAAPMGAGA
jgi:hypothetical protein